MYMRVFLKFFSFLNLDCQRWWNANYFVGCRCALRYNQIAFSNNYNRFLDWKVEPYLWMAEASEPRCNMNMYKSYGYLHIDQPPHRAYFIIVFSLLITYIFSREISGFILLIKDLSSQAVFFFTVWNFTEAIVTSRQVLHALSYIWKKRFKIQRNVINRKFNVFDVETVFYEKYYQSCFAFVKV